MTVRQLERKLEDRFFDIEAQLWRQRQALNTKVAFSAVKESPAGNFKGPITYEKLVINLGEGFDAGSGIFTAPYSGTYRFSFSAQSAVGNYDSTLTSSYTNVEVKKNGSRILIIYDSNQAENADGNNISYTWMMTLREND